MKKFYILINLFVFTFSPLFLLSEDRKALYHLKSEISDLQVYVDMPAKDDLPSGETIHVYLGTKDAMKKVEIKNFYEPNQYNHSLILFLEDNSTLIFPFYSHKGFGNGSLTSSSGSIEPLKAYLSPPALQLDSNNHLNTNKLLSSSIIPSNQSYLPSPHALNENTFGYFNIDQNQIMVEQIFEDFEGNRFLVLKFDSNNYEIGAKSLVFWSPNLSNTPPQYFQLDVRGYSGKLNSQGTISFKLTFTAPDIVNHKNGGTLILEKEGPLSLLCDEGKRCFTKLPSDEVSKVTSDIKSRKIILKGLPQTRKIEYIYKINDIYIVIDSPYYRDPYDFELFIGSEGNFKNAPIVVDRDRQDNGLVIYLPYNWEIFIPNPNSKEQPKLIKKSRNPEEFTLVRIKNTLNTLEALGLNLDRYSLFELNTPLSGTGKCDSFLKNL